MQDAEEKQQTHPSYQILC